MQRVAWGGTAHSWNHLVDVMFPHLISEMVQLVDHVLLEYRFTEQKATLSVYCSPLTLLEEASKRWSSGRI